MLDEAKDKISVEGLADYQSQQEDPKMQETENTSAEVYNSEPVYQDDTSVEISLSKANDD
jgi:hypothetical protein